MLASRCLSNCRPGLPAQIILREPGHQAAENPRGGPEQVETGKISHEEYHHSMELQLTAVFRKVPEGYIGFVEELPGANTQGATLEEARANLHEAVELVLQANRELIESADSCAKAPITPSM